MVKVNKKYKDRLFRMVFNRKEELISLYNAISHSEYTNPESVGTPVYMESKYAGPWSVLYCGGIQKVY